MTIVRRFQKDGYWYNQNTETWKKQWETTSCNLALQWPGYATVAPAWEHKGKKYVVQLWKGHCQKFLDNKDFPGGYGAEVGLYDYGVLHWYPSLAPLYEIQFTLSFVGLKDGKTYELINTATSPKSEEVSNRTWWQTEWMEPDSFTKFVAKSGGSANCPYAYHMRLDYSIDGVRNQWEG